jgi:hypothetical protein
MNIINKRTNLIYQLILFACAAVLLVACMGREGTPAAGVMPSHTPEVSPTSVTVDEVPGLSEDDIATLNSLEKIDDHPFYSMHYYGAYDPPTTSLTPPLTGQSWACSLFAAMADSQNLLYGRNFDWQHSPAVLLFTDPPDGYASVSMVDIAYLGFEGQGSKNLTDLPLSELEPLLAAPRLPFDGMNEHGLVVGMAAVPAGNMRSDPQKATIGSLGIIRQILDRARDVEQAVEIFGEYNIAVSGGPPIHYLIADRSGRAALVEFYRGRMVVTFNDGPWHQATNFLRASVTGSPEGQCWRYDRIAQSLAENQGVLTPQSAMDLLESVAQDSTQWSIVYDFGAGGIQVAMDRAYDQVYSFQLSP